MILLNAIYFNNKWEKEFPKDKTEEDIFYGCKNESLVYMMNIEDTFKYVETEKEQIIELRYKSYLTLKQQASFPKENKLTVCSYRFNPGRPFPACRPETEYRRCSRSVRSRR